MAQKTRSLTREDLIIFAYDHCLAVYNVAQNYTKEQLMRELQHHLGQDALLFSEDGRLIRNKTALHAPRPEFDATFLKELTMPKGVVKLRDNFYVPREADRRLFQEIVTNGTTIAIRAPRQAGKTSLLARGVSQANGENFKVVTLDFQEFSGDSLSSLDNFLWEIADSLCNELDLDETELEATWQGKRSPQRKLKQFMEKQVLSAFTEPLILAIDEADAILESDFSTEFFAMLRVWHNARAGMKGELWNKLNLVLVISTEPSLLIENSSQSPFNVATIIELRDFNGQQVQDLSQRYHLSLNQTDLAAMLTWLGGQPYLTRQAMYTMAKERLSWSQLNAMTQQNYAPFTDHLQHQYRYVANNPALQNALKEVMRRHNCKDFNIRQRLIDAGILMQLERDSYDFRCELYRLYFEQRLGR